MSKIHSRLLRLAALVLGGVGIAVVIVLASSRGDSSATNGPAAISLEQAVAVTLTPVGSGPQVAAVQALAREAADEARRISPEVLLLQMNFQWPERTYIFGFVDVGRTRMISVLGPSLDRGMSRWEVQSAFVPGLEHRPGPVDLDRMQADPGNVATAVKQFMPAMRLYGLTLFTQGGPLFWATFGRMPDETVVRCDIADSATSPAVKCGPPLRPPTVATP